MHFRDSPKVGSCGFRDVLVFLVTSIVTEKNCFCCFFSKNLDFLHFSQKWWQILTKMHSWDPPKFGSCGFRVVLGFLVTSIVTEKTYFCSSFFLKIWVFCICLKNGGKFWQKALKRPPKSRVLRFQGCAWISCNFNSNRENLLLLFFFSKNLDFLHFSQKWWQILTKMLSRDPPKVGYCGFRDVLGFVVTSIVTEKTYFCCSFL